VGSIPTRASINAIQSGGSPTAALPGQYSQRNFPRTHQYVPRSSVPLMDWTFPFWAGFSHHLFRCLNHEKILKKAQDLI
jgi:hypothetical protein